MAAAADVPDEDVTLQSYVLADTMVLKVTVITTSPPRTPLNELLITAAPAVEALVQPFAVEVLWPLPNSAKTVPVPPKSQLAQPESCNGAGWPGSWSGRLWQMEPAHVQALSSGHHCRSGRPTIFALQTALGRFGLHAQSIAATQPHGRVKLRLGGRQALAVDDDLFFRGTG